jgi:hypothetical protein
MKLITHVPSFMLNTKQHASKQSRKTRLRNPCVDCHRRLARPSQHGREPPKKSRRSRLAPTASRPSTSWENLTLKSALQAFLNKHSGILDFVWFHHQTSSYGAFSKVVCTETGHKHCRTCETTSRVRFKRSHRRLHRVQACLEAQGAHFQHLLWWSRVQHETRYVRY